jgi:hypothetical protein
MAAAIAVWSFCVFCEIHVACEGIGTGMILKLNRLINGSAGDNSQLQLMMMFLFFVFLVTCNLFRH